MLSFVRRIIPRRHNTHQTQPQASRTSTVVLILHAVAGPTNSHRLPDAPVSPYKTVDISPVRRATPEGRQRRGPLRTWGGPSVTARGEVWSRSVEPWPGIAYACLGTPDGRGQRRGTFRGSAAGSVRLELKRGQAHFSQWGVRRLGGGTLTSSSDHACLCSTFETGRTQWEEWIFASMQLWIGSSIVLSLASGVLPTPSEVRERW